MQNDKRIDALFSHWANQRYLQLAGGLSASDIRSFEARNKVVIPAGFARYLAHANGFVTPTGDAGLEGLDDEAFEFYPLSERCLLTPRYLTFCSWTVGFLEYAVCVDQSDETGTVIRVIDENRGYRLAQSFEEFIELYVSNSDLLYLPGSKMTALK